LICIKKLTSNKASYASENDFVLELKAASH